MLDIEYLQELVFLLDEQHALNCDSSVRAGDVVRALQVPHKERQH